MKNSHKTNIPMGRITNIVGKAPVLGKGHERIYDMIAQDYAERHNVPYVHVFENGEFVKTIARKEKYMTKEPKSSKNENKCPFSHKWNKDVDKTPDCDNCNKWEDCINNRT